MLLEDLKTLNKHYKKYKNYTDKWFVFGGLQPLADSTTHARKNAIIKSLNENGINLKNIRIHDLRHSCASLLINQGASITLVAKYLGHSNVAMTLNTYTHLFKNEFDDIINIINKLEN